MEVPAEDEPHSALRQLVNHHAQRLSLRVVVHNWLNSLDDDSSQHVELLSHPRLILEAGKLEKTIHVSAAYPVQRQS